MASDKLVSYEKTKIGYKLSLTIRPLSLLKLGCYGIYCYQLIYGNNRLLMFLPLGLKLAVSFAIIVMESAFITAKSFMRQSILPYYFSNFRFKK